MAKVGRKAYQPNKKDLKIVTMLAASGVPAEKIAEAIGVSKPIIYLHYKKELQTAALEANAEVIGSLFKMAKAGNVAAAIFWLKTRAKWSEQPESDPADKERQRFRFEIVPMSDSE